MAAVYQASKGEETLQICDPALVYQPIALPGMNMSCNPARRGLPLHNKENVSL